MEKNLPLLLVAYIILFTAACEREAAVAEAGSVPSGARGQQASGDNITVDVGDTDASDTVAGFTRATPVRGTVPCTVGRLIDGDTIECLGTGNVRLIGMDTPERSQRPHDRQATQALNAMLAGASVTLEFDVERRDRYDRLLAYVWADTTMVNLAMVRHGWAVVLTYPPNVQYVDRFTKAQAEARERGAGLWGTGGFDCLPRDRRRGRC